jgi:hypothetical protein
MTHDRNYYRQCSEVQLIDAAQDSDSELAIALGERLAGCLYRQHEIKNLEGHIIDLKAEIARLEGEVTALGGKC